jgi:hypothetical protein
MLDIVKKCKVHGELTIDQTRKDGNLLRCKQCRIEANKRSYDANRDKRIETSTKWKLDNRERANAWERADRAKNPEKYRAREKIYKKRNWAKLSVHESLRKLNLKNEDFIQLNDKHKGLCAICNEPEKRISRNGGICRLAIDHCHFCEENGNDGWHAIRGLLCHECNKSLGGFKDNIDLLNSAIRYLQQHEHIKDDVTGVIQ